MSQSGSKEGAGAAPRTAGEMLRLGREFLARKRIAEARLDAELLVAHALGVDRLRLFLELDRPLAAEEVERGRELLARRAKREPVAYITGRREFYGRTFAVDASVLIPRPETELLVDRAREIAREKGRTDLRFLDVGTGSGAIAVTLALELAGSRVVGVDVSAAALEVARRNAAGLDVPEGAVEFVEGDGALAVRALGPFDFVVSNPPYVPAEARDSLEPEVRDHEPALALFAPAGDPDHWVRRLIAEAQELLVTGGVLLVEIGHDQAERAVGLAGAWTKRVHVDMAKVPRVVEVRFSEQAS